MPNLKPAARPSAVTIRADASGITVVNSGGHTIKIAVSPSSDGFNPLELQAAALGVCTSLGIRREAKAAQAADAFRSFELRVEGFKASDLPSRLQRFAIELSAEGDLEDDAGDEIRQSILSRAEQACTIANTLRSPAVVDAVLKETADASG